MRAAPAFHPLMAARSQNVRTAASLRAFAGRIGRRAPRFPCAGSGSGRPRSRFAKAATAFPRCSASSRPTPASQTLNSSAFMKSASNRSAGLTQIHKGTRYQADDRPRTLDLGDDVARLRRPRLRGASSFPQRLGVSYRGLTPAIAPKTRPRNRRPRAFAACAAAPGPRLRSAAEPSTGARRPCAPGAAAQRPQARRRSRHPGSASLGRRNDLSTDASARSAARASQATGAPAQRPRPLTRQWVSAGCPFGSTFIHQPRLSSRRPSARSMVRSRPPASATIAQ